MKTASIVLRVLGYCWCAVAMLLILTGTIVIWLREGFLEVLRLFSPFNIWNFLAVAAILAPGFLLIVLADYVAKRSDRA